MIDKNDELVMINNDELMIKIRAYCYYDYDDL